MRYAVDAVTILRVAVDDERPRHQLVAPNSLRSQALELLLLEVRDGRLQEREALRIHERLTTVPVRLLGDRVSRRTAWDLARRFDLGSLREAEYLAVARLQADALVTVDRHLAALAGDVVPLAGYEALFDDPTDSE